MPFRLFFLPSYERCVKKLGARERRTAGLVVSALTDYFRSGASITGSPHVIQSGGRSYRLVFKKLRGSVWEAYIEQRLRVLTRLENDAHFLVFAGNHDQVRQFLKPGNWHLSPITVSCF